MTARSSTAEDVVHTVNRINTDQQSKQKQNTGPIKEIVALDQYTVKIVTKQPTASLLEYLFDRVFITGKDLSTSTEFATSIANTHGDGGPTSSRSW